jgi:hypothetical protein
MEGMMATVTSNKAMEWIAEYDYCDALVASGGNSDVPAASMLSYLTMQANSARREGFTKIAREIEILASGI